MKTFARIVFGLAVLVFLINVFAKKSASDKPKVLPDAISAEDNRPIEPISKWRYSEETDKMDEKVRYFARIVSSNEVNFEFPYNGGSTLDMWIRKMNGRNEVILNVSKGQFIHSLGGNNLIKAKFDSSAPIVFSYNSAADHRSDRIFLNNSPKFIGKLKSAKKVMIQIDFFQASGKIFEFDTEGLIWNK